MNEHCSGCGVSFRREPGYFLGAMVISYFASSLLGIAIMLALFISEQMELVPAAVTSVVCVGILMPLFTRFAKIIWIRIDYRADPQNPL